MLSRCFHFGVFEIFVSSLFLSPFFLKKPCCISVTYKSLTESQEEDHDDRRCLYLPHCRRQCAPAILRYRRLITHLRYGTDSRDKHGIPDVQGLAASVGVLGTPGTLHHLGRHHRRCRHPWFHVGICPDQLPPGIGLLSRFHQYRHRSDYGEAA